jgi:CHAD domain-containing protein
VEIEKTISAVRILDAEGKTVVHLHLERGRAGEPGAEADRHAVPAVIRVVPVKGYDGALARVVGMLTDKMDAQRLADDELALAMHAAGRRLDDPSKVDTRLDPACPAGTAMRTLHAALLEIVVRNEPGTRTQVDTEFLHDFRVTVRRIRSALGQVKGVFPEADRARFAAEFKWLGDATGPARDADVFLLKLPAYRAQLPEHSRNDLEPLAGFLERRREAAYRELVAALDSKRYARLVEDWRAYLASPAVPDETAPLADRSIREVASARIRSVAKGVLKKGTAIDDDTPAEALHRLRIRCKKLRYLLDLFRSLYDADEIARLVRALKKLQDNLGDFNDCEVQQDWLTESAREMTAEGTAPVETLLAMGRLEDRLDLGQRKERQRFGRRFAAFATRDTRDRLRRLFAPEGGPRP